MAKYGDAAPSTAPVAVQLSGVKNAITEMSCLLCRFAAQRLAAVWNTFSACWPTRRAGVAADGRRWRRVVEAYAWRVAVDDDDAGRLRSRGRGERGERERDRCEPTWSRRPPSCRDRHDAVLADSHLTNRGSRRRSSPRSRRLAAPPRCRWNPTTAGRGPRPLRLWARGTPAPPRHGPPAGQSPCTRVRKAASRSGESAVPGPLFIDGQRRHRDVGDRGGSGGRGAATLQARGTEWKWTALPRRHRRRRLQAARTLCAWTNPPNKEARLVGVQLEHQPAA